jgi:hypothetical protein
MFASSPRSVNVGNSPPCPDCGSLHTFYFEDVGSRSPLVLICEGCIEAGDDVDHDADTVCEPTPLACLEVSRHG